MGQTPLKGSKILVISQLPPPIHGSTMMTETFLTAMADLGIGTRMVERRFSRAVNEIGRFSWRKVRSAAWMPFRLIGESVRYRPDAVVFFATNRRLSFLVDVLLSVFLRALRAPVVLYLHTSGYSTLSEHLGTRILARRLFSGSARVVLLGPSLAADVSTVAGEIDFDFIPNTVTPRVIANQNPQKRESFVFLSNLIPEKGAATFLEAAAMAASQIPNVDFIVAGSSSDATYMSALEERASAPDLEGRVRLIGPLFGSDKWETLSSSIALVFPSTYSLEAQPLTILEAMSVGTPTIAFDTGGIEDVVINGTTGALIMDREATSIARAMVRLATDREFASRLSAKTRNHFGSSFSLESYRERWERVLTDVIKHPVDRTKKRKASGRGIEVRG